MKKKEFPKSLKARASYVQSEKVSQGQNFWKNKELIDNQLNTVKGFLKRKSNNLYKSLQLQLGKGK